MDYHKAKGHFIARHYDKALAFVAWAALLATLVYLTGSLKERSEDQGRFQKKIEGMTRAYPMAVRASLEPYDRVMGTVERPFAMQPVVLEKKTGVALSKSLLVAPERVWCTECQNVIDYAAAQCAFCGADQPEDGVEGWRGDYIEDWWLDRYGFDKNNRYVSQRVLESGFTIKEIYVANSNRVIKSGLSVEDIIEANCDDMMNPANLPNRVKFLYLSADVEAQDFPLALSSKSKAPDGAPRFQFNVRVTNSSFPNMNQSFMVALGKEIGKTGWVVAEAVSREVEEARLGIDGKRTVERYTVTLRKDAKTIVLHERGGPVVSDFTVRMKCTRGDTHTEYVARSGEIFDFDGERYNVVIDDMTLNVVLQCVSDNEEPFALPPR
ncbi:MAG: hypothetical protein FWF84_04915 [Kiritimatiellaeota bacterium]|nr:hypothetical protein [Kiritimatiellota bacterium]